MPVKIRKLKAELRKAGFYSRPGKGSHEVWYYPLDHSIHVSLAGNEGNDAKPYQIKEVYSAIKRSKEI
jgi:predicted RNA binding protein YcfA (HicA-like mRNA interferase family)